MEKYYRDVELCTIGEGTSEVQRMVIARELLRSQEQPPLGISRAAWPGGSAAPTSPAWRTQTST